MTINHTVLNNQRLMRKVLYTQVKYQNQVLMNDT